ncbi:MAG: hypothetical protein ACI9SQ_001819 [Rubritalea sp.]|jgi:hypothetical protein|tara:strand:+ start:1092 stop:1274 length:183 start_codon:yes stop_codon:yes gene_type:complete
MSQESAKGMQHRISLYSKQTQPLKTPSEDNVFKPLLMKTYSPLSSNSTSQSELALGEAKE